MTAPYDPALWKLPAGMQPGQPNIGPGMPGTYPGTGGTSGQYGAITPDQNLIGTPLFSTPSADTSAARGYVGQNLGALQMAPDRAALAGQTYDELAAQSAPQFQTDLQNVGRKAATLGRIGAGITTTELGDVASNREKYLGNLRAQLATNAAGLSMQDRLNQLSAGQNVLGQFSGLDQQQYGNLVGERGYEQGLSQQAFQNNLAQNQLLSSLGGFGQVSPQDLAQQGQAGINSGSALLQYLMQNQKPQEPTYGYA